MFPMFDEIIEATRKKVIPQTCPFCGDVAYIDKKNRKKFRYVVQCSNGSCGCRTARWTTAEGAIRAWNRRTPPTETK